MKIISIRSICAAGAVLVLSTMLATASFAHNYAAPYFYLSGVYSNGKPNYPPASDEEMSWLLKQIQDADKDVRTIAAGALGQTNDKRAVEPLLKALKDRAEFVRMNATTGFVHIKDPRAIQTLAESMNDPEGMGDMSAAYALAAQGDAGIKALISVMSKQMSRGQDFRRKRQERRLSCRNPFCGDGRGCHGLGCRKL